MVEVTPLEAVRQAARLLRELDARNVTAANLLDAVADDMEVNVGVPGYAWGEAEAWAREILGLGQKEERNGT